MKKFIVGLLLLALASLPATAQTPQTVRVTGFAQASTGTPLTATTGGVTGALPSGAVILALNKSTTIVAYCKLGAAATVNDIAIQPGSYFSFQRGTATQITCMTSSSTAAISLVGGDNAPMGGGGGGGGGSGGGAVTIADGADVAEGATTDSASSAGGTGTVSAKLRLMTTQLATLNTTLQAPLAGVTQAQTGAAASSLVVKASAGSLVSISGSAVTGSYIMIFNATSAPADGAVTPVKCWGPMAAAGPFSFGWGPGPVLTMATGITVVSSSTGCFTKTATNANFISAEYQ
jgi:hypothetical protein